jgi:hypothetical protein
MRKYGIFLAKASFGLAVVVAATLAMVATETVLASGLLSDADLLLSLVN